jgi:hypothetical protein
MIERQIATFVLREKERQNTPSSMRARRRDRGALQAAAHLKVG